MTLSQQNIAHATSAQLSWHVQNFAVIPGTLTAWWCSFVKFWSWTSQFLVSRYPGEVHQFTCQQAVIHSWYPGKKQIHFPLHKIIQSRLSWCIHLWPYSLQWHYMYLKSLATQLFVQQVLQVNNEIYIKSILQALCHWWIPSQQTTNAESFSMLMLAHQQTQCPLPYTYLYFIFFFFFLTQHT